MRRLMLVCLPSAILLATAPAAHAQLGGLKKKVAEKVAGKPKDTVAASRTKPKCDNSSTVITNAVVDRYLKSLAARDAEIQKLAREPGKTGEYYDAVLKRWALQRRQADYEVHRGPDWEKHQALQKRIMTGDVDAAREDAALSESLDPYKVEVPEREWEAQQKGSARMDSVMRTAGGFSECDWLDVGAERMPRLVQMLAANPETKDLQGFGTPPEAGAIRPRLPELARGLGIKYVTPEDRARIKADEEKAQTSAQTSGDEQTDCIARAQTEWLKAHKAELDAAQKSQDVAALTKLSMQMQTEREKCNGQ